MKALVVHGHFYQPPRENAWTETLERQASARPDHDWNERVARECYVPNAVARIVDGQGRIVELVNNYAHLSFNMGPTLLSWYESAHPRSYRRLLEADKDSAARLEGHGNAIAQSYNHTILTLCDDRDLRTQILWGLADFRRRFGREPEAMWLPETACDDRVLSALAAHGMKYVILSPTQVDRVRKIGEKDWKDVSDGTVETRRAYRWTDPADPQRRIALFFYDGPLSHGLAFGKILADAPGTAARIAAAFSAKDDADEDLLVHAATDGESYGHHGAFMDMGLAHLFGVDLPEKKVQVVNYGWWLAKNPPLWEAHVKMGPQNKGTAWSCAHGVGRWMTDCGCGSEGRHQRWRGPMRLAFDSLRDDLARIFEAESKGLLQDCWAARDAYIDVVLDRSEVRVESFLKAHTDGELTPERRLKALQLLEMQRYGMLMYTSCGWFFSDISGIETVQNLQYAARACDLARTVSGKDLEPALEARLRLAPGNVSEYPDGAEVYKRLALGGRVDGDRVAAHFAVALLFDGEAQGWKWGRYRVKSSTPIHQHAAGARLTAGKAVFEDSFTGETFDRVFLAANLPGQALTAYVRDASLPPGEYDSFIDRVAGVAAWESVEPEKLACPLFPGKVYRLVDLMPDEQERLVRLMMRRRRENLEESPFFALDDCLALVEMGQQIGMDLPVSLRGQTETALEWWLERAGQSAAAAGDAQLGHIRQIVARARTAGLSLPRGDAQTVWIACYEKALAAVEKDFAGESLHRLRRVLEVLSETQFIGWHFDAQTRFHKLLKKRGAYQTDAGQVREETLKLAKLLNLAV